MEKKLKKKCYVLQLMGSARFMASSLPNFANNLSEAIHRIHVNSDAVAKNVKHVELNISIATVFLNTHFFKMI